MFSKLALYFKHLKQNAHWLRGDSEYADIETYPSIATQKRREPKPIELPVARLVYEVEDKLECVRQREIGENE